MLNTQIVIGPNASLSSVQALWVMASISAVALSVAAGFAALGFWLVLPFAGLELLALGAGLWVSLRRNRYQEVLTFEADRVRVGFGWQGRGAVAQTDWPRPFVRVALERGASRNSHTRLVLMSSGQRLLIGQCLSDAEREQLHLRLKDLLPPVWFARLAGQPDEGPARAAEQTGSVRQVGSGR